MTVQPTRQFTGKFTRKLITALLAACILPVALPMFPATAAPGYKPPRRQSAQRTESSGYRDQYFRSGDAKDCAKDLAVPLTLIVPKEQTSIDRKSTVTPETTLEKPSLYVYLTTPKQLKLALYEGTTLLWKEPITVKDSGISEIAYPDKQKGLEVGKTYTWGVEIVCQLETVPSSRKVGSRVTRVPVPSDLQQQLKTTTSPRQRAELYARSGFWTETMVSTAEALESSTDKMDAEKDLLGLLEQIGLKEIADREQANNPTPETKPVVAPSPTATPTPTPKPPVSPKPADPKKPCH